MDFLGRSSRIIFSFSFSLSLSLSLSVEREKITRDRYTCLIYRSLPSSSSRVISSRSSVIAVCSSCSGDRVVSCPMFVAFVRERALEISRTFAEYRTRVASIRRVSHCGDFGGQSRADRRGIISRRGKREAAKGHGRKSIVSRDRKLGNEFARSRSCGPYRS